MNIIIFITSFVNNIHINMIEIFDVYKYHKYRNQKGPYTVFFFDRRNGEVRNQQNIALIKKLQSLEIKYKDVPILGFEYVSFINFYKNVITSCLDIMIIQQYKENILYQKPPCDSISSILDIVRQKRFDLLKENNKDYKKGRKSMRVWFCKSKQNKIDPSLKSEEERIGIQNLLMGIKSKERISSIKFICNSYLAQTNLESFYKKRNKCRKSYNKKTNCQIYIRNKNSQTNDKNKNCVSKFINEVLPTYPNILKDNCKQSYLLKSQLNSKPFINKNDAHYFNDQLISQNNFISEGNAYPINPKKSYLQYNNYNYSNFQKGEIDPLSYQYKNELHINYHNQMNNTNYQTDSHKTILPIKTTIQNFDTIDFFNIKSKPEKDTNVENDILIPLIKSDELC